MELIKQAIEKGAKLYASISGGKDGQAMVKTLQNWGFDIAGLVHADLGRVEWPQSAEMCLRLQRETKIPLHVVRRSDGLDMLAYWTRRKNKLIGTGKPFWSSAQNRYCTSDLKRGPINKFFTACEDFIISCEGVRAQESASRAKKSPIEIRWSKCSSYYNSIHDEQAAAVKKIDAWEKEEKRKKGVNKSAVTGQADIDRKAVIATAVQKVISSFVPGKKLALTWYPIFYFTAADVWNTYGVNVMDLRMARAEYKKTGIVPEWWPFHPAYVFGNDRVSCMFCVLGSLNDLTVAAGQNPKLLQEMINLEEEGGATFKHNWSLKELPSTNVIV